MQIIFDRNAYTRDSLRDIICVVPDDKILRTKRYFIVVAVVTDKYVEEIVSYLENLGLRRGEDFLCYTDLSRIVLDACYNDMRRRWRHIQE